MPSNIMNQYKKHGSGTVVLALPLLFARGKPASINEMTLSQLEEFFSYMMQCCLKELKKKSLLSQESCPQWWPHKIPFKFPIFHKNENRLKSIFIDLITRCYTFHGCQYILNLCESLAKNKNNRMVNNRNGTTSIYSDSWQLIATFNNENKLCGKVCEKFNNVPLNGLNLSDCNNDLFLCDKCDDVFKTLRDVEQHESICKGIISRRKTNNIEQNNPKSSKNIYNNNEQMFSYLELLNKKNEKASSISSRRMSETPAKPIRSNYFYFHRLDVSSPLGKYIMSRRKSGSDIQVPAYFLTKFEKYLKEDDFDTHDKSSSSDGWFIAWCPPWRSHDWSHTYSFNSKQKRENLLTINAGFSKNCRSLILKCKPCCVKIENMGVKTLQKWLKLGSCKVEMTRPKVKENGSTYVSILKCKPCCVKIEKMGVKTLQKWLKLGSCKVEMTRPKVKENGSTYVSILDSSNLLDNLPHNEGTWELEDSQQSSSKLETVALPDQLKNGLLDKIGIVKLQDREFCKVGSRNGRLNFRNTNLKIRPCSVNIGRYINKVNPKTFSLSYDVDSMELKGSQLEVSSKLKTVVAPQDKNIRIDLLDEVGFGELQDSKFNELKITPCKVKIRRHQINGVDLNTVNLNDDDDDTANLNDDDDTANLNKHEYSENKPKKFISIKNCREDINTNVDNVNSNYSENNTYNRNNSISSSANNNSQTSICSNALDLSVDSINTYLRLRPRDLGRTNEKDREYKLKLRPIIKPKSYREIDDILNQIDFYSNEELTEKNSPVLKQSYSERDIEHTTNFSYNTGYRRGDNSYAQCNGNRPVYDSPCNGHPSRPSFNGQNVENVYTIDDEITIMNKKNHDYEFDIKSELMIDEKVHNYASNIKLEPAISDYDQSNNKLKPLVNGFLSKPEYDNFDRDVNKSFQHTSTYGNSNDINNFCDKQFDNDISERKRFNKESREMKELLGDECRELKRKGLKALTSIDKKMTRCTAEKFFKRNKLKSFKKSSKKSHFKNKMFSEKNLKLSDKSVFIEQSAGNYHFIHDINSNLEGVADNHQTSNQLENLDALETTEIQYLNSEYQHKDDCDRVSSIKNERKSLKLSTKKNSDFHNNFKTLKRSSELIRLAQDECKEFRSKGFHPSDFLFTPAQYLDTLNEKRASRPQKISPKITLLPSPPTRKRHDSYGSDDGTTDAFHVAETEAVPDSAQDRMSCSDDANDVENRCKNKETNDKVFKCSDKEVNNLIKNKKHVSKELSSLMMDEWKEGRKSGFHPIQIKNLLSSSRNSRSIHHSPKYLNYRAQSKVNNSDNSYRDNFSRNHHKAASSKYLDYKSPRFYHKEMLTNPKDVCVVNYKFLY